MSYPKTGSRGGPKWSGENDFPSGPRICTGTRAAFATGLKAAVVRVSQARARDKQVRKIVDLKSKKQQKWGTNGALAFFGI